MTGPHLVVKVAIPNARIHDGLALNGTADLVQYISLTCIFGQIVTKLVLNDLEEQNLLLLHHHHYYNLIK